jgi:hypothetical protein
MPAAAARARAEFAAGGGKEGAGRGGGISDVAQQQQRRAATAGRRHARAHDGSGASSFFFTCQALGQRARGKVEKLLGRPLLEKAVLGHVVRNVQQHRLRRVAVEPAHGDALNLHRGKGPRSKGRQRLAPATTGEKPLRASPSYQRRSCARAC